MIELLSIIGQLYDAALDPELWHGVLGRISLFLNAERITLILEDATDPQRSIYRSYPDPEWIKRYIQGYLLINPMRLAMVAQVTAGDIVLTSDFITQAEYRRTRFSKELLADNGLVDIAAAVLEKSATCITVLSVKRGIAQGFADEILRAKLELLTPHVQRAVRIGRLFEQKKMEASSFADTLDKLSAAILLVDSVGTIVHANAKARDIVETPLVIRNAGGALILRDAKARTQLSTALEMAAKGDEALGANGTSILVRGSGEDMYVAIVMPLTDGARRRVGDPYRAVAAVAITPAEFQPPSNADLLAQRFNLTRREMTVLMAAVECGGPQEIASVLGLSPNTARSHLKTIFRKTGASRQADLIKLLSGVATPFG